MHLHFLKRLTTHPTIPLVRGGDESVIIISALPPKKIAANNEEKLKEIKLSERQISAIFGFLKMGANTKLLIRRIFSHEEISKSFPLYSGHVSDVPNRKCGKELIIVIS